MPMRYTLGDGTNTIEKLNERIQLLEIENNSLRNEINLLQSKIYSFESLELRGDYSEIYSYQTIPICET